SPLSKRWVSKSSLKVSRPSNSSNRCNRWLMAFRGIGLPHLKECPKICPFLGYSFKGHIDLMIVILGYLLVIPLYPLTYHYFLELQLPQPIIPMVAISIEGKLSVE